MKFYDPPAIAKLLRVTPMKVRGWIEAEELKASNVGDKSRPRWKIREDHFNEFLNSRGNFVRDAQPKKRRRRAKTSVPEVF